MRNNLSVGRNVFVWWFGDWIKGVIIEDRPNEYFRFIVKFNVRDIRRNITQSEIRDNDMFIMPRDEG